MLYYVPLEGYKERYTMQWSAPITGWQERNWREAGIEYTRIDGEQVSREIKTGSVVDAVGRSIHCFSQIKELLFLAEQNKITNQDVIYFDDFWHPGIEALPYAFHLMGIKPRMYAFLHAQSVDEYDFTHPMRHWMRHFEKGIGTALEGIFVCCPFLQRLVVEGGIAPPYKVHVTGHPFSSEEVRERMPVYGLDYPRENKVIWSSRWDSEKNPDFFLKVALNIINREIKEYGKPRTRFVVCTGAQKLRSNNPELLAILNGSKLVFPNNIILKENLSKEEYYTELCTAKVQFNCADQDFVAITLLEASVAGCYPVYPEFRSFPETFWYNREFMYPHKYEAGATEKLWNALQLPDSTWSTAEITRRQWIHERFDYSWLRMAILMRLPTPLLNPDSPQMRFLSLKGMYPLQSYMNQSHTE